MPWWISTPAPALSTARPAAPARAGPALIAPVVTSSIGQPTTETASVTRHQRPNTAPIRIRVGITAGSFPVSTTGPVLA
jgi:hypothetical protein